jgi:hypothetical protein
VNSRILLFASSSFLNIGSGALGSIEMTFNIEALASLETKSDYE